MKGKFRFHAVNADQLRAFKNEPEVLKRLDEIMRACPVITVPEVPEREFNVFPEMGNYIIFNPEVERYEVDEEALARLYKPEVLHGREDGDGLNVSYSEMAEVLEDYDLKTKKTTMREVEQRGFFTFFKREPDFSLFAG